MLVDWQIDRLIDEGLTDPQWKPLINPASMDVTISHEGLLLVPPDQYAENDVVDAVGNHFRCVVVDGIQAGDRMLLVTQQQFHFPRDIGGTIRLKSSRGREWYEHLEAGWVDPGFKGRLTLEIVNHSYITLPLYAGQRIAQIVFQESTYYPMSSYQGKYQGDGTVSTSKDQCPTPVFDPDVSFRGATACTAPKVTVAATTPS